MADPAPPLLDMHCHCAGIGAGGSGCYLAPRLRHNWRLRFYLSAFDTSLNELQVRGDTWVIQRIADGLRQSRWIDGAIVLALDGVVDRHGQLDLDQTQIYIPNDYLAEALAPYPNLHLGASVHPARGDALARLHQAKRLGTRLIKWLPAIQHIDPAERRWIPFYETLAELDLPLLCHTGSEYAFPHRHQTLGDPQRLRLALEVGVKVIAAHAAAGGRTAGEPNLRRLSALMHAFPHLYADCSSLTQVNRLGALSRLRERPLIRERLLYGSDFPLINTPLVHPGWFLGRAPWHDIRDSLGLKSPWDRDLALKQALGLDAEQMHRVARSLRLDA